MSPRLHTSAVNVPSVLFALLSVGYPLLVYFGLLHFSVRWVALCLALLLALRLLWLYRTRVARADTNADTNNKPLYVALTLAIVCALISTILNHTGALRLIPSVINAAFLLAFASTLWKPPSMIERFSRLGNPNPSEKIIAYTRNVTMVWCGFFLLNGLTALYTALFSSMATWTLYNGLISYVLMGILFTAEYTVRLRVKARDAASLSASA